MENTSGIYKIYFTDNPTHFYIGSSNNLNRRKRDHLTKLRTLNHYNLKLQNAFNKHKEVNFNFEIVQFCSPSDLLSTEQHYIDFLHPYYNIAPKVQGGVGTQWYVGRIPKIKKGIDTFKLVYGLTTLTRKCRRKDKVTANSYTKFDLDPSIIYRTLSQEELDLGYWVPNESGHFFIRVKRCQHTYSKKKGIIRSVSFNVKILNYSGSFKTLQEALDFRNQYILKEMSLSEFIKSNNLNYYLSTSKKLLPQHYSNLPI